ncbi:MAG: hypothetical protein HYU99_07835, partial [Deltaproteobacteria bacterium]|nr:hypothetical protein [Deltaproteobacteria bacterium]
MSGGEEIRKIGGSLSLSVGDFTNGAGVSLALEGNGARNTGGISDPGGERDAFARVPERSVRFNRSIARLKIDRRKSVTVLLDYTDSIGQQRPNPAQLDEALERLIAVLDLLHKNKHVSQVYLWGTFPLELRVRAMALRREYPKLQPPVSSPLKNVLMANRDGVVGKKRISRTYLDGIFAESALSHNLVVIDNGETRWPFHLAGLAQVVIPKGAEDVVDCVRQLVHKLNHAYEQTVVIDPASSDDIAPFAVALRQRVAQLISEGKERATLADLRPRIHTRDLADFLHPDRIRFVFKDPELHGFVAVILELEAMGSLPVTPEATGSPPVSLAQAEGDGGGINGPTRTGGDDGGGPFRDPPYPSLSRFSTKLPESYDPLNGLLTLRGEKGEKTLTIDLGIPGLPPPTVEAHSQYLIRILWRPEDPEFDDPPFRLALVLRYDPESGRVEVRETVKKGEANDKKVCDIKRALSKWLQDSGEEFVKQHLFGLKERASTGILPLPLPSGATQTVDLDLPDFFSYRTVSRVDRMSFRWGVDPKNNYELIVDYRYFRDRWGGIDHGLSVAASGSSFSYAGGARQPDDVRGLKAVIDQFIARAGRETIPKMAESHYADDVAPNTARY